MLTDDALRGVLQCLQPHQKLFCVLDCCHSGTGMDLKYELYDRGGSSYRFIPGEGKTDTPGHVFLLSGCRDSQTSAESLVTTTTQQADGSIATEREIRGALTSTLVPILKRTEAAPRCDRLLSELRKTLQMGGFSQIAQLSAGRRESPPRPASSRVGRRRPPISKRNHPESFCG